MAQNPSKVSQYKQSLQRADQGCGVGVGVGVGIFYPTPTPHVQFLYVLVMLTAQLTQPRASGVQCSNLFKRTLPRIARHSVRLIKSLHFNL